MENVCVVFLLIVIANTFYIVVARRSLGNLRYSQSMPAEARKKHLRNGNKRIFGLVQVGAGKNGGFGIGGGFGLGLGPMGGRQSPTPVQTVPIAAEINSMAMDAEINSMDAGMNSMNGGINPMNGGINPMDGGMNPMDGGMNPMDGGMNPMNGGMNPMAGGMNSMNGGLNTVTEEMWQKQTRQEQGERLISMTS